MADALISCLIPTFNCGQYLAEAIDSVLAQTYRPIEITVVDDGSTDDTPEIAARYADDVRYVYQAHSGVAVARNRCVLEACGEFIAFLDADDLWEPEKLELQMGRFRARPELEVCLTRVQNFWIPELADEAEQYRDRRYSEAVDGYVCQSMLTRRNYFDLVGGFNPDLPVCEDSDWFMRMREKSAMVEVVPRMLVHRRLHYDNITRQRLSDFPDMLLNVAKLARDRRRAASRVDAGARSPEPAP